MGSLRTDFLEVLPYMPRAREKQKRTRSLTLDALLDEGRKQNPLRGGALDLLLMAYRYHHVFTRELHAFRDKPLKPADLEDLLSLAFGALLTRSETPVHAIVNEAVQTARDTWGDHTSGLTNAFLRRVSGSVEALKAQLQKDPLPLLSPELRRRWPKDLQTRAATQLLERPESGITAFNEKGQFSRILLDDLRRDKKWQAMDPGSWALLQWLAPQLKAEQKILDACSAPGGKLIGLHILLSQEGKEPQLWATDAAFPRLERLRQNLERWQLAIPNTLMPWGDKRSGFAVPYPPDWPSHFDVIIADLPCSASGTLHSAPDLLLADFRDRVESLRPLQSAVIAALRERLAPGGKLCVGICSVDPEEVAGISHMVGKAPDFSSWQQSPALCEGLYAWYI